MASWDDAPSKIYMPLPWTKATGCGLTRWYSGGWDIVLDGLMGTFEWHSQRYLLPSLQDADVKLKSGVGSYDR